MISECWGPVGNHEGDVSKGQYCLSCGLDSKERIPTPHPNAAEQRQEAKKESE